MATAAPQTGQSPAPMNVFARFIGIITSPRLTFENVVAHPRALGIIAVICVLSVIVLGGFFSTKTGQDAWLESVIARAGSDMTDQQIAAMERMAPYMGYIAIAQSVIGVPIMMLLIAVLLWAVFNAVMGGTGTFKQVFTVVAHAWVILAVSQLFTIPLSYANGTLSSAANLGVLLPMIDDQSFLGRFVGTIDFFIIWAVIVLAIGLGVLYRRKTQPIAITFLGIYAVIAICIAAIMS